MSKCDCYVVSARKTMCGAIKIRKVKIENLRCITCDCVCDMLIKALPYVAITIIGCVVGCQLAESKKSGISETHLKWEVRQGTNVVYTVTYGVKSGGQ